MELKPVLNNPFKDGRASDANGETVNASLDACRYHALLGLIQASGSAGGHDYYGNHRHSQRKYPIKKLSLQATRKASC